MKNRHSKHILASAILGASLALNACAEDVDFEDNFDDVDELEEHEAALVGDAYSQCDDILAQGLYNTFLQTRNETTAGVLTDWKCEEFKRSGKVDTEYWGYGYVDADASWERAEKTCSQKQHAYTASSFSTYALAQTADDGIVNAWRDCMRTHNKGFVCDIEAPVGAGKLIQFNIDWQTIAQDPKLTLAWPTLLNVTKLTTLPTRITTEGARGYDFNINNLNTTASIRVNAEGPAGAFTCNIVVHPKPAPLPKPTIVPINCRVESNNAGCSYTASCPSGKHIAGAKAACNLEYGEVTSSQVSNLSRDTLKVVRTSDNVAEGMCSLGGISFTSGERNIASLHGKKSVIAACKEHDKNGGDCHIRGELVCVAD